ncbi:MAG: transporter substrate-binding domain-containing protein [Chromatiales bacterium]
MTVPAPWFPWISHLLRTALAVAMLLPPGLRADDLERIREAGVLRHLGVPYANFVTGAGDGLDVELMRGFAEHLGVRYEFVQTDWRHAFGDLTGRHVRRSDEGVEYLEDTAIRGDVLANGVTILPWREEVVDFSEPTFPTAVWLVARADSSLQPIEPTGSLPGDIRVVKGSLDGRSVLGLTNTCLDPGLYRMDETGAEMRLLPKLRQLNEMVPAILNRDAEATLLDVPDALIALERWPGEIKIIGPISEEQAMGVAFRKDSDGLRQAFNRYYARLRETGAYQAQVRHYYPAVFRYYAEFFDSN